MDGSIWIDLSIDRSINPLIHRSIDPSIHQMIHELIYELMDRWIDQSMDWPMDRLIDWCIDRWMDGWMDKLIGGPVEGRESYRECVYEIESKDCVIIGGRSTHFEISRCAIYLVDGLKCKCKCKRWFLFYYFLWTFWETSKSKALEIVYRSYARALKGWRLFGLSRM